MFSFIGQKITQSVHLLRLLILLALSLSLYSIGLAGPYSTSGSGNVSPSGAYTYSVPIALPAGSAGASPQFNLVFDSRSGGNGLLGRGWDISGFSQITRCGKAISTDGIKSGIAFNASDNYCLNGQRLFLKSGTHGSNGAEYVTEQATHNRIVLYTNDALSGGAHYFKMWTKTGDIITFGSPDINKGIRVTRAGRTMIYAWPATRVEDRSGNYTELEYIQETANNLSYHPLAVRWSGNEALELAPYNIMTLVYETRPERRRGYRLGHEIYSDKRLDSIKIYTDSQLINTYEIDYSAATALTPSQVTLIRVCASDNDCHHPLNFSWPLWPTPSSSRTASASSILSSLNPFGSGLGKTSAGVETMFSMVGSPNMTITADAAGASSGGAFAAAFSSSSSDQIEMGVTSKVDLSQLFKVQPLQRISYLGYDDKYSAYKRRPRPWRSNVNYYQYYSRFDYRSGDFDGDGRTELLQLHPDGYRILDYAGNGAFNVNPSFTKPRNYDMVGDESYKFNFQTGDYNGDGLSDLLHIAGNNSTKLWLGKGDNTFTQLSTDLSNMSSSGYKIYSGGDFNGDGRSDLFHADAIDRGRVLLSDGDGTFTTTRLDIDRQHVYREYFSHGHSRNRCSGHVKTHYRGLCTRSCTGSGKNQQCRTNCQPCNYTEYHTHTTISNHGSIVKKGEYAEYKYVLGDYDGDGLTDIFQAINGSKVLIHFSKGDGTFRKSENALPEVGYNAGAGDYKYSAGDFNGDGLTDLFHIISPTVSRTWLSKGDGTFALGTPITTNVQGRDGTDYNLNFVDINGDGLTDIWHIKSNREIQQWLSIGDGGFALSEVTTLGFNLQGTDSARHGGDSLVGIPIKYLFVAGDFNGNGAIDYVHFKDKGALRILESTLTPASYQLETVKTEGGADVTITYDSLSGLESTFYEKGTTSLSYPRTHVIAPIYAVSELSTEGSANDYYGTSYRYKNLRAHLERGLEGFGSFISRDDETGIETEMSYIQSFPYTGLASLVVQTDTESDIELSRIESSYTVKIVPLPLEQSSYEIYLSKRKETGHDLNGTSLPTMETQNWYGANGNLLTISVSASDGWGQLTRNIYADDVGENWLLGRLVTAVVKSWGPNTPPLTRESSFSYSEETGYLEQETIEPNTPTLSSSKNYERDAFGNIVMSRVKAYGVDTRLESSIAYDARGRFIIQESNALGHTQSHRYDERLGNMLTLTGANGLRTKWEYDNWGRATLETLSDGTWSSTSYGKCDDTCPPAASYYIRNQDITGGDSYAYYDEWDRELETRSNGFATDTWIVNKVIYDRWGRITRRSLPHYSGETDISWVKTEYDKLGRPTEIILPNKAKTRYEYNGLDKIEINALDQRKLTRKDSKGNVIKVIEYGDRDRSFIDEIASGNSHIFSGNYDGIDGDELLSYRNGSANYKILNITSNTVTEHTFVPGGVSLSTLALAFDWNNDDKTDIVDIDAINNIIRVYSSSAFGWQTQSYTLTTDLSSDKKAYMLSDYDRDDRIELGHHRGGGTVDVYESYGASLTVTYSVSDSLSDCTAVISHQGAGTQDDPYLIRDICELQKITLNLSANYRLANDIDARITRSWEQFTITRWRTTLTHSGFTPIDTFSGELDGANHIIRGVYISDLYLNNVGLFGRIDGVTIRRIGLVESEHIGRGRNGLLVGKMGDGNSNHFEDIWISGRASGYIGVGGLIGYIRGDASAKIANVGASVSIVGSSGGGLIGSNFYAGSAWLTVNNSYVTGSIEGRGRASVGIGGLYGELGGTAKMVASNNYSRALVIRRRLRHYGGGVAGLIYSPTSHLNFNGVYWDLDLSRQSVSSYDWSQARPTPGKRAGISRLTSEQLTCPTAANNTTCKSGETLYADWPEDIWYFGTEKEAPILRTTPKGYREGWLVGDFDADGVVDSIKSDLKVLFMSNSTAAEAEETLSEVQSGAITVTPRSSPTPSVIRVTITSEIASVSSELASGNSHIFSGNYDGIDGDELLSYRNGSANYRILNITSNTSTEKAFVPGGVSLSTLALAFDWNNDDKTDIVDIDSINNVIRVHSSSAFGWQTQSYTLTTDLSSDKKAYMLSDYDRDDKIELGHHRGGGTIDVYESNGTSLTVTYSVSDSFSDCAAVTRHQGAGTQDNPYLIRDICELQNITLNLSANYQLANDIDARMTRLWNFTPIGKVFSGELDGANHIIRGMYMNRGGYEANIGLFSQINGGAVRRIGLVESEHIDASTAGRTRNKGLLVGQLAGSNSSQLEDIWISGTSNGGQDRIGGLVGRIEHANVKIANVGVSVSIVNGIYGIGGLIGSNYSTTSARLTVTNSYVTGNIEGESAIGGLYGALYDSNIVESNNYSRAVATSRTPGWSGSMVGHMRGTTESDDFNSTYWDMDLMDRAIGIESGGVRLELSGSTSDQLSCPTAPNNTTCQSGKTLYANWSEDIWYFGTEKEAPILRTTPKGYREGWIVGDFDNDGVMDSLKADGKVLFMSDSTAAETKETLSSLQTAAQTITPAPTPNDKLNAHLLNAIPSISYRYNAHGNLLETEDVAGNIISVTYDRLGRKIALDDPDLGKWRYFYDGLGQLTMQIDAKDQRSYNHYDKLGRVTLAQENSMTVVNTYDSGNKAIGKLSSTRSGNNYSRSQVYDDYGRLVQTTVGLDSDYAISVTYDTSGRIQSRHWPTGFAVTMNYTAGGHLLNVMGSDGIKYLDIKTVDANGNLVGFVYGNQVSTTVTYDDLGRLTDISAGSNGSVQSKSYGFDLIGNITRRIDRNLNHIETFRYDDWNRLTENRLRGLNNTLWKGVNANNIQRVNYNALGNITYKSDVGNYTYSLNKPHAVARVSGAKYHSYEYDANGNQISGAGRNISYTSFNKVSRLGVLKDGVSVTYEYEYGSERQRVKERKGEEETYYINPEGSGLFYEKVIVGGGLTVTHKHYIKVGGILVAVKEQVEDDTGTSYKTKYFHPDHLGSTDVISDEAGIVKHRNSYDAWGKRRHATVQANGSVEDTNGSIVSAYTRRGYTEHEHIDEAGLINANGRLYDPLLGRFLQADPVLQAPENPQNYNRYSYVLNNPLSYTDPTGFELISILTAITAFITTHYVAIVTFAAVVTVAAVVTGNPLLTQIAGLAWGFAIPGGNIFQALGAGFLSGFVGSGGDLNAGLTSAATAALFAGVGEAFNPNVGKIIDTPAGLQRTGGLFAAQHGQTLHHIAHGVVGGISSVLQGGKFGHGFVSASFTKFVSPHHLGEQGKFSIERLLSHAVVGGTVSTLTGGKFANGAQTGAFGYLYNDEGQKKEGSIFSWFDPLINGFDIVINGSAGEAESVHRPLRKELEDSVDPNNASMKNINIDLIAREKIAALNLSAAYIQDGLFSLGVAIGRLTKPVLRFSRGVGNKTLKWIGLDNAESVVDGVPIANDAINTLKER